MKEQKTPKFIGLNELKIVYIIIELSALRKNSTA